MGLVSILFKAFGASLFYLAYSRNMVAAGISGGLFVAAVALLTVKRSIAVSKPPPSSPVPKGKVRICVAGFEIASPTAKSHYLADMVARKYPDLFETWYYFDSYAFFAFTREKFESVSFPAHLKGHATSPFVWLETGASNVIEPLGGSDHFSAWVLANNKITDPAIRAYAEAPWKVSAYLTGTANHAGKAPATCRA